jgi:hypothetical protein
MSGDDFKGKFDNFFNYLSENIKEKLHLDYIEENFTNLKELCIIINKNN